MSQKPIQIQSLRVEDFSGGITDYYKGNQDTTQYEKADNLVINDNQDLVTRPGSEIYDSDAPQIAAGNANVMEVIECDDVVYQHSGRSLYYITGGTSTEVVGPSSNKVFPAGDEDSKGSFAIWNNHLLCANDQYSPIMRVYKDSGGTIRCNNLGLPYITLYNLIDLANDLKAKFNSHIADASDHTTAADAVNTITSDDADDFDSLVTLVTELLTNYDAHEGDAELGSSWVYHAAQEASDHSLITTDAPTSLFEINERLVDLKDKFNAHDADSTAHGVGSQYQSSVSNVPTGAGTAGSNNYIYALYASHTYNVGEVTYKERGPVTYVEVSSVNEPSANTVTISNIADIINGSTNNYATSDIKIEIGRTQNNGDVFYYLGEITNGTASYADSLDDDDLINNATIYVEGGVLDNEPPPRAKYIKIVNDALICANIKEGSIIRPNKVRMSKRLQPFACPSVFFDEFEDTIMGLGGLNVYPIPMLANRTYRLEGFFDARGLGGYQKQEISTRIGTVSHRSIVNVREGLVFASSDGFYFSDEFKVLKVSTNINERYQALSSKENICGCYDKKRNAVLWGVQSNSSSEHNDTIYMAHANYTTSQGKAPFTTWSGGNDADNFSATCLAYIGEKILRGDHRGYLLQHSDDVYTDPKIDTSKAVANWFTSTIIYDYRSNAYDFGSGDLRKWVSKIVINADNETSISMQIESNNDNSGIFTELAPIVDRGNPEWGDPTIIWGEDSIRWNYYPVISAWRRFGSPLRCQYKQVKFTNDYTLIDNSEVVGTVDVDSATQTVTLNDYPAQEWLPDAGGYFISFDNDSYAQEFQIDDVSDADVTVIDGGGNLEDLSGAEFRIRGYKKREVLSLLNYVIQYSYITTTQSQYGGDLGE